MNSVYIGITITIQGKCLWVTSEYCVSFRKRCQPPSALEFCLKFLWKAIPVVAGKPLILNEYDRFYTASARTKISTTDFEVPLHDIVWHSSVPWNGNQSLMTKFFQPVRQPFPVTVECIALWVWLRPIIILWTRQVAIVVEHTMPKQRFNKPLDKLLIASI